MVIGVTSIQMELQLKTVEYTEARVALIGSNYVFKKLTSVKNPFVTFRPSIRYSGRWRLLLRRLRRIIEMYLRSTLYENTV